MEQGLTEIDNITDLINSSPDLGNISKDEVDKILRIKDVQYYGKELAQLGFKMNVQCVYRVSRRKNFVNFLVDLEENPFDYLKFFNKEQNSSLFEMVVDEKVTSSITELQQLFLNVVDTGNSNRYLDKIIELNRRYDVISSSYKNQQFAEYLLTVGFYGLNENDEVIQYILENYSYLCDLSYLLGVAILCANLYAVKELVKLTTDVVLEDYSDISEHNFDIDVVIFLHENFDFSKVLNYYIHKYTSMIRLGSDPVEITKLLKCLLDHCPYDELIEKVRQFST